MSNETDRTREAAARRFASVLFVADHLEGVPYEDLRHAIATHSFVCVRGLFEREAVRRTLDGIREHFRPKDDRRHNPLDSNAARSNFQKLQIGANSGVNSRRTLGRFMRVLYNPIFADDVLGMRETFIKLAKFRNHLYRLPVDHAVTGTDDGFWTCSRLLQYPTGGGFIVPHRDMYAQIATTDAGLGYFQPLLLMTEKGRDFQQGGAYVDVGEERFYYEEFCQSGDVIVYDGRSVHGVSDIDPLSDLELVAFSGRVVALASLFKLLNPDTNDYEEMGKRARRLQAD